MMSQPVRQCQNGGTGVTIHVLSDIQTSILNKLGQKSNKKLLGAIYINIYYFSPIDRTHNVFVFLSPHCNGLGTTHPSHESHAIIA